MKHWYYCFIAAVILVMLIFLGTGIGFCVTYPINSTGFFVGLGFQLVNLPLDGFLAYLLFCHKTDEEIVEEQWSQQRRQHHHYEQIN